MPLRARIGATVVLVSLRMASSTTSKVGDVAPLREISSETFR